jgi:hypothetical protein
MTARILIFSALVALGMTGSALAQTCAFSGADWEPSASRVKLVVNDEGEDRTLYFGGPAHAFYYLNDIYGADAKVVSAQIVDYNTRASKAPKMLDASTAWYVVDGDLYVDGTEADPPVIALATEASAKTWQQRVGGTVVQGWDAAWDWMAKRYDGTNATMGDRRAHFERESY